MRILIVNNFYQYQGGTDHYVKALYNLLKRKGHKVLLYKEESSTINTFKEKIKVGFNALLSNNLDFCKIIEEFKPDICHLNNIFPKINFSVVKACKKRKIPVVQTVHDFRYIHLNGIYKKEKNRNLLINYISDTLNRKYHGSYLSSLIIAICLIMGRKYIESLDAYLFPNKFSKEAFNNYFDFTGKSYVLPHFISFNCAKTARKKNDFVYIGRISEEKGVRELIKVFKTLPNLKLKVVGEGPLRDSLERLKVPNVKFLGYVSSEKKYEVLGHASFCIIPSKIEELGPLVLIESFMCGTPVIVPDLFSFKEKVIDNKSGFYYTHSSISSLRDTIIRASEMFNRKKCNYRRMSEFVREDYLRKYREDLYYKSLLRIYEKVR